MADRWHVRMPLGATIQSAFEGAVYPALAHHELGYRAINLLHKVLQRSDIVVARQKPRKPATLLDVVRSQADVFPLSTQVGDEAQS